MKKLIALVMALLIVALCGVATAEDAPKIGVAIYQFADNFMTLYRTELARYLTED